MRLLVYLVFAVSFMFGQIVAASPREDAEYIAERMMSDNDYAFVSQRIASTYVTFFTKELGKHSAKVVDSDRFAEMIPVNVLEPWIMRWQEIYVDRLLKNFTPAQLVQSVNNINALDEKSGASQAVDIKDIGVVMGATLQFLTIEFIVHPEIKQSMPKLIEAPYLADILETDGIFSFPNRIWRRDLIAKIRSGD